ncbi:MAG TPA: hypothetical protein VG248_11170 [Caulobacteraceae bacterium]|jgi:hypothetical protein|nr:hypothetical protein [Caulobacteraceae bacterium]
MNFRFPLAAMGVASLLGLATAAPAANLLQNPGFETGSLSSWSDSSAQWSVTTATANSGVYSATVAGNHELIQNFAPTPVSSITDISFAMGDTAQFNAVDFFYADTTMDEIYLEPSATNFTVEDVTSQLTAGETLVGIGFYGNGGGVTWLDDVQVTTGAGAAPEPAAWATMILGMFAAGAVLRHRRSGRLAAA